MPSANPQPSFLRIVAGFIAAPGAVSVVAGSVLAFPSFLIAIVIYPIALLTGIPAFLICRDQQLRPTLLNCVLVGAGTAFFVRISVLALSYPNAPFAAQWILTWTAIIVGSGAFAGFVFWLVVFAGAPKPSAPAIDKV